VLVPMLAQVYVVGDTDNETGRQLSELPLSTVVVVMLADPMIRICNF